MKTAAFKSDFALLDVTTGRKNLAKRLDRKSIRVLVELTIDDIWGGDDGTSQEFSCTVLSVKEMAP